MALLNKAKNYLREISFNFKVGSTFTDKIKLSIQLLRFHWYNRKGIKSRVEEKVKKYTISLSQSKQDLFLRSFSGDLFIFYEVLLDECYYLPKECTKNVQTIVDLGSNIGLSSLYYFQHFPKADFICVEPSPTNFQLLQKNTAIIPANQIDRYEGAIHSVSGEVSFEVDAIAWGGKMDTSTNSKSQKVKAYSMGEIIQKSNIQSIDILKVDIEGGEAFLFSENTDWLKLVKLIIIEIHSPYGLSQLKADLETYGFEVIPPKKGGKVQMITAISKALQ
jgi:FkbM family methyltransferase